MADVSTTRNLFSRRRFLFGAALAVSSASLLAACGNPAVSTSQPTSAPAQPAAAQPQASLDAARQPYTAQDIAQARHWLAQSTMQTLWPNLNLPVRPANKISSAMNSGAGSKFNVPPARPS